jgi:hypothetical protein
MNFLRPKSAISLNDFRDAFKENILIVSDLRSSVGRPRKSVLGDERSQITPEVAARVATAQVADMEKKGQVFEPAAQFLYDIGRRSEQAKKWCSDMAKTNREAEDEDAYRLVNKMCGSLITIGKRKRNAVRISTVSATPAELRIFADLQWTKGRRENNLSDKLAKAVRRVADHMADGESFEEGMARHYDAIRRGEEDFGELA